MKRGPETTRISDTHSIKIHYRFISFDLIMQGEWYIGACYLLFWSYIDMHIYIWELEKFLLMADENGTKLCAWILFMPIIKLMSARMNIEIVEEKKKIFIRCRKFFFLSVFGFLSCGGSGNNGATLTQSRNKLDIFYILSSFSLVLARRTNL